MDTYLAENPKYQGPKTRLSESTMERRKQIVVGRFKNQIGHYCGIPMRTEKGEDYLDGLQIQLSSSKQLNLIVCIGRFVFKEEPYINLKYRTGAGIQMAHDIRHDFNEPHLCNVTVACLDARAVCIQGFHQFMWCSGSPVEDDYEIDPKTGLKKCFFENYETENGSQGWFNGEDISHNFKAVFGDKSYAVYDLPPGIDREVLMHEEL